MIVIKDYTEPEECIDSNQHPDLPQHPFRLLITGSISAGKTNLMLNLVYDYLDFDVLYLCAKDIYEPKYRRLQENYTMFDDIEREDILNCKNIKRRKELLALFDKYKKKVNISSNLKEFVTVDDLNPDEKNLVIFDDCVTEKYQKLIEDLFFRGRKKNASIIYLSQSYYSTPINIRRNCNYFIFFNLQLREIQQIIREIDGSLSKEEFTKLYKICVQKRFDFFMLDLLNSNKRYRKNFDPINGRIFTEKNVRLP